MGNAHVRGSGYANDPVIKTGPRLRLFTDTSSKGCKKSYKTALRSRGTRSKRCERNTEPLALSCMWTQNPVLFCSALDAQPLLSQNSYNLIKGLITWARLAQLAGLTRVTNIFSRQQKILINLRNLLHLN